MILHLLKFVLLYVTTIESKFVYQCLSLVLMFYVMWSFVHNDYAKFAIFFQHVHDISDINVNMAIKKLQIPLFYVHPFTTHLFDFITNF